MIDKISEVKSDDRCDRLCWIYLGAVHTNGHGPSLICDFKVIVYRPF